MSIRLLTFQSEIIKSTEKATPVILITVDRCTEYQYTVSGVVI
jgi:hypothetical protein